MVLLARTNGNGSDSQSNMIDRPVPYDLAAEEAVLGSLLIDRDAIIKIAPFLKPADFYREANGWIYTAILDLYHRREPADTILLASELDRQGKLEQVGNYAYLFHLINSTPTAVHVEYYAHKVEEAAVRRRLITGGGQIAALGYEENADLPAVLDSAEQILFAITQRINSQDFTSLRDILESYFDRMELVHEHKGTIVGVPSGFHDLDELTGGLQKSDLIIGAARPATGKTSFALSIAHNAARAGKNVGVFSLEMSAEQIVQRLLSIESSVDMQRLRLGYLNDTEWQRLSDAFGRLAEVPIYIDDSAALSVMELRSRARRLQAEIGVDLLIVDYLQLMQGRRAGGSDNRVQEVSEITRGLKQLARELDAPIIALSQLSRAVESRQSHVPMLSDLRESGCLTGDTPVYLPDQGTYRPIEQLVGQRDFMVLALNTATWQLEPARVTHAFATGTKPVYRLISRLGRTIRATANHKFLTIHGWRRLDELAVGERLALPRHLPGPREATMTEEELALLGHLIGDGCTLPNHAIQYTTREYALAETVAALAGRVFGATIRPRIQQERTWYQVYLAATETLTHRKHNPVVSWLTSLGVFGLRSYEKRVPDQVFAQPAAGIARFLRHLWATDGCIHLSQPGSINIYYASSSLELARNVQSLLLRLGINAVLGCYPQPGKGRDQYHVMVMSKPDIERFLAGVGGLGQAKAQHQTAILAHLATRGTNTNRDVLPREVWRLHAVPAMQAAGLTTREMQARLGNAYCGTGLYKQNLSRDRAARLAQVVGSPQLTQLAHSDVYWDEITAIEPDGAAEVYDLTVDALHNFVAGDIVVHNSIEQDADIVMFIYREELYNPETERKGIAEIHVAKHRNGPTGVVPLRFFPETTRFADLEVYRQPAP